MRNDFEASTSALIDGNPYCRSQRGNDTKNATVSAIDFSAGHKSSGADLRWHPKRDFNNLPNDQKDELVEWMKINDGKKVIKKSRDAFLSNKNRNHNGDYNKKSSTKSEGNWKKCFKKAIKTTKGLNKVMSVLAKEEKKIQLLFLP